MHSRGFRDDYCCVQTQSVKYDTIATHILLYYCRYKDKKSREDIIAAGDIHLDTDQMVVMNPLSLHNDVSSTLERTIEDSSASGKVYPNAGTKEVDFDSIPWPTFEDFDFEKKH